MIRLMGGEDVGEVRDDLNRLFNRRGIYLGVEA